MYNVHDRSIVTTQNVTADLDEDEMLMRAIAMSLEVEEEVEEREVDEEKLCFTRHHGTGELVKTNPMWLSVSLAPPGDEEDEEEMLKRAIAMSLEEQL